MTTKQLAEKIFHIFQVPIPSDMLSEEINGIPQESIMRSLESLLAEFQAEVVESANSRIADMRGKCYSKVAEQDLRKSKASAYEKAANKLKEYIGYHYDEAKNDCAVCGAMLSKCDENCIIPDFLKCLDEIKQLAEKVK